MAPVPALALLYPTLLASLTSLDNYAVFPGGDGVPYLIDTTEAPLTYAEEIILHKELNNVQFKLFTRRNRGEDIIPGEVESITKSTWDPKNPTRFITHGWRSSGTSESCMLIRDAYLQAGDYNVIIVNWQMIAGNILYPKVAASVPVVANYVASVIDFMVTYGRMDLSTTKLVGHSLGAHVAGLAARGTTGKVAEVVALDPAKPLFENALPGKRVDATDAENVQVIHTNAGTLGMTSVVGSSDFFPNEGKWQPGCPGTDFFGTCSHSRSYEYYAESVKNPTGFRGFSTTLSLTPSYKNEKAYMGGPTLDPAAKGSYVLSTGSHPPFALN